jgi:hypothetical protein
VPEPGTGFDLTDSRSDKWHRMAGRYCVRLN